ncbi:MAG TPA: diaminopimelate epimerase [Candidatus Binatia bacterium]|nr:diaminopimelate epimerase [Candidatus Binatia bacterium]
MALVFTKMHGLGNDFVVIDATRRPFHPTPAQARRIADRRYGAGCDQIAVIERASAPGADFEYRVYNMDGSESGMSGNGARCVARFLRDQGLSRGPVIRLRTRTALVELHPLDDGQVRVNMGTPRFEPATLPFTAAAEAPRYTLTLDDGAPLEIGAVSMGNPHAVIEVPDTGSAPVAAIGAALQRHPAFPQSVNVGFLQVCSPSSARLRVYERGAGETLACGSGACGAMAVGRRWGRLGERVDMELRGGTLRLEWPGGDAALWMTGPAQTVYRGEMEWDESERGEATWEKQA